MIATSYYNSLALILDVKIQENPRLCKIVSPLSKSTHKQSSVQIEACLTILVSGRVLCQHQNKTTRLELTKHYLKTRPLDPGVQF
jgi:hypothetical protein